MVHFPMLDAKKAELKKILDDSGPDDDLTKVSIKGHHTPGEKMTYIRRLGDEIKELQRVLDAAESGHGTESGDGANPDAKGGSRGKGGAPYGRPPGTAEQARAWAHAAADKLVKSARERGVKAVVTGSFDAPNMVHVGTVTMPANPSRLLDLLVDRQPLAGNEFEFLRQTARTDNAAAVADNATKPTSVYTLTSIQDRVRVYAHLSEAIPERILQDHGDIADFLEMEMSRGVLDALEGDIVSGAASAENVTGIVNTTGIGVTAYATSIPTTLRKGYTASQTAKEQPTAWALNPADAEALDLMTTADGEYIVDASAYSNVFKNLPVVVSTSVPSGKAILADWRLARLFVRQDMTLDFDRSGVLFQKNQIQARCEGRFGFALLRPSAFRVINTA